MVLRGLGSLSPDVAAAFSQAECASGAMVNPRCAGPGRCACSPERAFRRHRRTFPARSTTCVIIDVTVAPIDGTGGILGQAGPNCLRDTFVPLVGEMRFDSADVANLLPDGTSPRSCSTR